MTGPAKLMSVEDVCDYLGVSRYFVYDQVRLGRLPCARIARQLRFRPDDLDVFIEAHVISSPPQALRAVGTTDSHPGRRRRA